MTDEERIKIFNRWRSYVRNNPKKYRIEICGIHGYYRSFLSEYFKVFKDSSRKGWERVESLPDWSLQYGKEMDKVTKVDRIVYMAKQSGIKKEE